VAVRPAVRVNGIGTFALTKLDVLEGVDPIKLCVAYKINGKRVTEFPAGRGAQMKIVPIYKNFKGFKGNLREIKDYNKWPKEARTFVAALEKEIDAKCALISLGKARNETIVLDKHVPWLK
jgi:adenylosuccinate synthase